MFDGFTRLAVVESIVELASLDWACDLALAVLLSVDCIPLGFLDKVDPIPLCPALLITDIALAPLPWCLLLRFDDKVEPNFELLCPLAALDNVLPKRDVPEEMFECALLERL